MSKYTRGARLDRKIIITAVQGGDLSRFPLYHAPNVITVRGAIEMARAAGIKVERKVVNQTPKDGVLETTAIIWVTGSPTASASISHDETYGVDIATGLAFRNAIERLLGEPPKIWRRKNTELEFV